MGKNKLKRFEENLTFRNLIQPAFDEVFRTNHPLKGHWRQDFFGNDHPIVVELGCGRGEYTLALARKFPGINFIGVDIKGARLGRGAKTASEEGLNNAGFLRTRIEFISAMFGPEEINELWITFPDPQLKKGRVKKRLTAPAFLEYYAGFLVKGAPIHLKTDSLHLHRYTKAVIEKNGLTTEAACEDIYGNNYADEILSIKTAYETQFLKQGLPITYLRFNLGARKKFEMPPFEPDENLS